MLTLHKTSVEIKTILKWITITISSLIVLLLILRIGTNLKEYFFPTPPPPPTVSFGKLTKINFPTNPNTNSFTYTLNNLTGKLPNFPDRVKVYKIIPPESTLLSLKRAQEKIIKIGFYQEGKPLSDITYEWKTDSKKIILDISSLNFNYSSDFFSDKDVLSGNNLPDENTSIKKGVSFLSAISFPNDIDSAKTKVTLLSINGSKIIPASSLSTAKIIRVDFFQKNIDNLPIFYPNPEQSTMYAMSAGGKYEGQIITASFFHQNISDKSGTYPIKTSQTAFEELKNGQGFIASYFGEEKEILIKDIYLGYYLEGEKQDYLMPIIIFEGSKGFFAYVSAVSENWIQN